MSEETVNHETPQKPDQPVKPDATLKVPRILLEILISGHRNSHDAKIKKLLKNIQTQFDQLPKKDQQRVRAMWKVDGDITLEEKKQWLIDNCSCKYYIFTPTTFAVAPDFVKMALKKVNQLETAIQQAKMYGLIVAKKPAPKSETPAETPAETQDENRAPLKVVE